MQPLSYPVQYENLKKYWRAFVDSGSLGEEMAGEVDAPILRSWQRCFIKMDARGNPRPKVVSSHGLALIHRSQANLIPVALPLMEDIHQFLEGSDCAILLADSSACLHTVVGDETGLEALVRNGLGQGVYWSEGQLGTNALGLALTDALPIQVVGPEHYYKAFHKLTTTAAPIHDIRGRIIGILGVMGPDSSSTSHTLSLVMAAARAISNQLQTDWFLDEANLRLTEVKTVLNAVSEGVIAWDESGHITHMNEQAGAILGLNTAAIVGRSQGMAFSLPAAIAEAAADGRELRNYETTFSIGSRDIACLVNFRIIRPTRSRPRGYIALLQPIERVRELVQQQIGARATLTLQELSSQSPGMRQTLRQASVAARGRAPVLICGEGGVGKNHLARAIHNDSHRASKPFIAIDCRAIPHEVMASEFLGRERQTGFLDQPSKFELAQGGTLLLDQVESLSLELQTVLLRVLETGTVMRSGGSRQIQLDLRIMAATAADLKDLVADGRFNAQLYYRFGVFNIHVPPVRDRPEDIELLVQRILARISSPGESPLQISEEAKTLLCRYPWPGNVREMESVLERASSQCEDSTIQAMDLPESVRFGRVISKDSPLAEPVPTVADAEREAIIRAGMAFNGRVGEMARHLGIGRTTLWRKMKNLDITPDSFKSKEPLSRP